MRKVKMRRIIMEKMECISGVSDLKIGDIIKYVGESYVNDQFGFPANYQSSTGGISLPQTTIAQVFGNGMFSIGPNYGLKKVIYKKVIDKGNQSVAVKIINTTPETPEFDVITDDDFKQHNYIKATKDEVRLEML